MFLVSQFESGHQTTSTPRDRGLGLRGGEKLLAVDKLESIHSMNRSITDKPVKAMKSLGVCDVNTSTSQKLINSNVRLNKVAHCSWRHFNHSRRHFFECCVQCLQLCWHASAWVATASDLTSDAAAFKSEGPTPGLEAPSANGHHLDSAGTRITW